MNYQNRLTENSKLQEKIRFHRPLDSFKLKQLKEYYRIGVTWYSDAQNNVCNYSNQWH